MICKDYLYTNIYSAINELKLEDGSLYIYGDSQEDRSNAVISYYTQNDIDDQVVFLKLSLDHNDLDVALDTDKNIKYNLRNPNDLGKIITNNGHKPHIIYLDISTLAERIIAALMHYSHIHSHEIRIIYISPDDYQIREFQRAGALQDLSTEINGIIPLPGFASINSDDNNIEQSKLIVFIGFEGGRFTHIYEQIDINIDNIFPVVGIPGYKIEYPFISLWSNRQVLIKSGAWRNMRYCTANSIVDAYYQLNEITQNISENTIIKIVPIGTKPQTIATLAFALKHPERVEIIFDNPSITHRRTSGVGVIIETNLKSLMTEEWDQ